MMKNNSQKRAPHYLFKLGVDGGERSGFLIFDEGADFRTHIDKHDALKGKYRLSESPDYCVPMPFWSNL